MLLYITAEDVLGDASPERRGKRPLHTIPATLSALYDMGMRHHVRSAAMLWPRDSGFEAVADWKLDRLVIRVALYARERLGLDPGGSLAVVGGMGWLWPVVDFAAMGFGAASLGIGPDVPDDALVEALGRQRAERGLRDGRGGGGAPRSPCGGPAVSPAPSSRPRA